MKITLDKPTDVDDEEFPILRSFKFHGKGQKLIVLFTAPKEGVVLYAKNVDRYVGEHGVNFVDYSDSTFWTSYNGKITFQN